jgi:hypothetical protein
MKGAMEIPSRASLSSVRYVKGLEPLPHGPGAVAFGNYVECVGGGTLGSQAVRSMYLSRSVYCSSMQRRTWMHRRVLVRDVVLMPSFSKVGAAGRLHARAV